MANTLSPSIATVHFSGFRVYSSLRGTGTNCVSSVTCILFGKPSPLPLLRHRFTTSGYTLAPASASSRRRNGSSSTTTRQGKASKKPVPQPQSKHLQMNEDGSDGDDLDEDAFEALFSMLEEDLKNDNLLDADDEIAEEDLNKFEEELDAVLDDIDDLEGDGDDDEDEDEEEEMSMPKLRNWQRRRLAAALKQGRRKTSIKNLAAELALERAVVLKLLREPPPDLLLMSASLPDKKAEVPPPIEKESKEAEIEDPMTPESQVTDADEPKVTAAPVHVMQSQWASQKRLKKVHVETLEKVYCRTKRPTNAMISSIVHLTNLPSKTVVKWFEDKRTQDGIPKRPQRYQRSGT